MCVNGGLVQNNPDSDRANDAFGFRGQVGKFLLGADRLILPPGVTHPKAGGDGRRASATRREQVKMTHKPQLL